MVTSAVHIDVEDDTATNTRQERSSSLAIGSRRVFVGLLALATVLFFNELYHLHSSQSTQVSPEYQHNADITPANSPTTLPPVAGHTPEQHENQEDNRRKKAQVFDIIPFNGELDQLGTRLNELNTVVDTFVIIESEQTFSCMPKPLYYLTDKDRFQDFQSNIIHIVLPPIPDEERMRIRGGTYSRPGWQEEVFKRNKGFQLAFEMGQPQEGDWFIVSDLDEIPRKSAILALHGFDSTEPWDRTYFSGPNKDARNVIPQVKDIYRFELSRPGGECDTTGEGDPENVQQHEGKDETEFQEVINHKNRTRDEVRLYYEAWKKNWQDGGFRVQWLCTRKEIALLNNACWHCTYGQSNISQIIYKLQSLSHLELNTKKFTNKEWIITRAKIGGNLFQRWVERLTYLPGNRNVPEYVDADRDRFQYLLDIHDKPNAGFLDVDPNYPFA